MLKKVALVWIFSSWITKTRVTFMGNHLNGGFPFEIFLNYIFYDSLVKLCDKESSVKSCEWCLGDGQENVSWLFEVGRGFEDRIIFEVFLLTIFMRR